jgi:hypothetical protein
MLKTLVRLVIWTVVLLVAAGALGAWALLPRHFPEAVACPVASDPRVAVRKGEGTLTLIFNDCLLSTRGSAEIRTWYDNNPLAPIAEVRGYPMWNTGLWSFGVQQRVDLPPAAAYQGSAATQVAESFRTAILAETSYTLYW